MVKILSLFGLYSITFLTFHLEFLWPNVESLFNLLMICKSGVHQNMIAFCFFTRSIPWQKFNLTGLFTLKWRPCQPQRKLFGGTVSLPGRDVVGPSSDWDRLVLVQELILNGQINESFLLVPHGRSMALKHRGQYPSTTTLPSLHFGLGTRKDGLSRCGSRHFCASMNFLIQGTKTASERESVVF